jgi:hypothetical protein
MRTLADRYSLEDCVLDGPRWSYWRGYDGVLRRSVGVLVLEPDHPAEAEVMAAARASAGAEDPRVLRVLDVLTDDEGTCFVIEWLTADSLEDLLREGPLADREAWFTVSETARALAAVAQQGLTHGALAPHWVLRGDDGRVRLLGLSIAGALSGAAADHAPGTADEVAREDARGLGALLYAALTGRWPGDPADCSLPPAPRQSGHPVRPRMVLAGVAADLDDVAARALGLPGRGAPLVTASAVAEALDAAGHRLRGVDPLQGPSDLPGLLSGMTAVTTGPGRPGGRRRSVPLVAAVVVVALLAIPSYLGVRSLSGSPATAVTHPTATVSVTPSPAASPPTGAAIAIASVRDFDPPPGGNGSENPSMVKFATDGNLATAWMTVPYFTPDLGRLKSGVGLLLDLGQVTEVGAVSVNLVGLGTSLELRSATTFQPQGDDYTPIAKAEHAGSFVTLRPVAPTKARYLLIWLTSLPSDGSTYRGGIAEIHVYRN